MARVFLEAESKKLTHLAKVLVNQDGLIDDKWLQGQENEADDVCVRRWGDSGDNNERAGSEMARIWRWREDNGGEK